MNNWSEIERLERKSNRQIWVIRVLAALYLLLILSAGIYFYNLPEIKKTRSGNFGNIAECLTLKLKHMLSKSTTSNPIPQALIAGLIPGSGIEFFGISETKEVKWLQNGHVKSFEELPAPAFICLLNHYRKTSGAVSTISQEATSLKRQVELFAYYMYGGLDSKPDMVNGELQEPENYRHSRDCVSLSFKQLKINGIPLKEREIKIIDMAQDEAKGAAVAMELNIAESTLNQHKKALFNKAGVQSTPGLLMAAFRDNLISSQP